MAVLDPNEMFFTAFEPKVQNRFIMYVDGFPSYIIKSVGGMGFDQGEITLNHINTYRKVKGKLRWNDITLSLYDPITPSGAQAVMEWTRLHHESVTGRDGFADFYKKDITFNVLDPVGAKVEEWKLFGCYVTKADFGDMSWEEDGTPMLVTLDIRFDYAVLNF